MKIFRKRIKKGWLSSLTCNSFSYIFSFLDMISAKLPGLPNFGFFFASLRFNNFTLYMRRVVEVVKYRFDKINEDLV